jgi:hypothetical protein
MNFRSHTGIYVMACEILYKEIPHTFLKMLRETLFLHVRNYRHRPRNDVRLWSFMIGVCCSGSYAMKGKAEFLICLIQDRAIQLVRGRAIAWTQEA